MPASESGRDRPGAKLALWVALTVALQGVLWGTGFKTAALADAVERGAARTERLRIAEVGDDLVRKAVRMQESTRPFWTALALLGDFLVEPLALAVRALAAATVLAGLAALVGRPTGFPRAVAENIDAQGFWVLGLATRVALALAMRRDGAETSLALALPPGDHPAALWVALRQADAFALLGWSWMARGAWRRGQANLATSALVCALLWLAESTLRAASVLVFEAGMRLTLLPE